MLSPDQQKPTCVVILFSIHFVLKAEKILKKNNINHDIIPVPREISSDCGMAVEFACHDKERVTDLLSSEGLRIAGIYAKEGKDLFRIILEENETTNSVH